MPYSRYFGHMRSAATCQACGARVRLTGYRWLLVAAAALVLVFAVVIWRFGPTPTTYMVGGGIAFALTLALDVWSWRALPWTPVETDEPEAS